MILEDSVKLLIVKLIIFYQKNAPQSIRDACRFKPTCSEYMKLALKKYGLLKGVTKSFYRICRCRPPNGGIDYP
jgi:putative membrane protein insertion efficiency factor